MDGPITWSQALGYNQEHTYDEETQTKACQSKTDTHNWAEVYHTTTGPPDCHCHHLFKASRTEKWKESQFCELAKQINYINTCSEVKHIEQDSKWRHGWSFFLFKLVSLGNYHFKNTKACSAHFTAYSHPAGKVALMWYSIRRCGLNIAHSKSLKLNPNCTHLRPCCPLSASVLLSLPSYCH